MCDQDGTPFDVEPRNVLNRLWQQLRNRGLFPVIRFAERLSEAGFLDGVAENVHGENRGRKITPFFPDPQRIAQLLLTMCDQDGTPFDVEPRNVLNRLWQRLSSEYT
jgi:glutamine synthetase